MAVIDCPDCNGTGGPPGFTSSRIICRSCEGRKTIPVPKSRRSFEGDVLDEYPKGLQIFQLTTYWPNHPDYNSGPVGAFYRIGHDDNPVFFIGATRRSQGADRLCIVVKKTDGDHADGFDGYFQDDQENPTTLTIVDWFYVSGSVPWEKLDEGS